jgi:hypothetical protein
MASNDPQPTPSHDEHAPDKHWLQKIMDNPWILLVLGLLIPALSYTAWGWIELLFIQPAQLP